MVARLEAEAAPEVGITVEDLPTEAEIPVVSEEQVDLVIELALGEASLGQLITMLMSGEVLENQTGT